MSYFTRDRQRNQEGGRARWAGFAFAVVVLACVSAGLAMSQTVSNAPGSPANGEQASFNEALGMMRASPRITAEYDYVMTGRVRLLVFWAGKDDVGGGYIRRGTYGDDQRTDVYQILMGSDPAKTPRSINRWGAGTEVVRRAATNGDRTGGDRTGRSGGAESSAFFGFMKSSKGNSVSAMEKELSQEKQGGAFLFSAILSQTDRNGALAKTVPFTSFTDYNIHQLDQAQPVALDHLLQSAGTIHSSGVAQTWGCDRPEGFLSSVSELVDDALDERAAPVTICYVYDGETHALSLTRVTRVPHETVKLSLQGDARPYERAYDDLLLLHVENVNKTNNRESSFELLVGTEGDLRGVPVRISYQPNWWFQVVLNLKTPEHGGSRETVSFR